MIDLIALFDELKAPRETSTEGARFRACPVPGYDSHRLAKDPNGNPAILIKVIDSPKIIEYSPIRLEHLSILYGATCRVIRVNGIVERDTFTVIRCIDGTDELNTYFLRIMSVILAVIGMYPKQEDLNNTISSLVELFRALALPPRKSIQGLWGEVFLISRTRHVKTMIDAWHSQPESLHDFALGLQRIEVKTSSRRIRQHHFSLEQLCPPRKINLLIASLFVEKSTDGISIIDLAAKVRLILNDPNRLLKFERLIAQTLGTSWQNAAEERFDHRLAETSLAFFEVSQIPCPSRKIPAKVRAVHFESDLSESHPADIRKYVKIGALFGAI